MKAHPLATNYDCLTPEERFRLILAASQRGDEAERGRLGRAGARLTLSMSGHAPYAYAFEQLALLIFIELLEEAAGYFEALAKMGDADDEAEEQVDERDGEESAEDDDGQRPAWQQCLDLALAAGYLLRTKANGWRQFCEQMQVDPFLLFEGLPGFDRIKRALALAEEAAFAAEGFLKWLNAVRPETEPELTEVPLTAAAVAAATEKIFRQRVRWWGG